MPEACVLIPVYNGARWIEEALDSALAQQGTDLEILVVDDGSTDATPEILRRRAAGASGRIRVLTIPHGGRSHARNVGADHVEAEFITLLDADDRMHPLRVKLECDALRAHPDAAVSFAGRWDFDDGSDVGKWVTTPEDFGVRPGEIFTRLADPISTMIAAGAGPGTNACTCRARWARERGRFDPAYEIFEDPERWLRALYDTPAVYVAAPLYHRRLHPTARGLVWSAIARAQFAAIDSARANWSRYSPEQRARISWFEKSTGASVARLAAQADGPAQGVRFLLRHADRLHGLLWWRTLVYLLMPPWLHAACRPRRPGGSGASQPGIPLAEAMAPDPARIWSRGARAASAPPGRD